MKKTILSLILLQFTLLITCQPASAAEPASARELSGFGGGALVGAAAGGPVGAIIGAALGAQFGHSSEQGRILADNNMSLQIANHEALGELTTSQKQLQELEEQLETTRQQVQSLNSEIDQLFIERALVSGLQFDLHFGTDKAAISDSDRQRLRILADLLKRIPEARVQLSGHADMRGEPDYNDTLSLDRAFAVADTLNQLGVQTGKIHTFAFGESMVTALDGEQDAYSQDRRVNIELIIDEKADTPEKVTASR